ncbi:hypothetical protein [Nocardia ninae]|uniref:hypothetical protein n=1 Tax=Nocardia ninae TaxID=356145 RepID=UPI0011BF6E0B|nr:hypothetical protein [Nocardia ninae]
MTATEHHRVPTTMMHTQLSQAGPGRGSPGHTAAGSPGLRTNRANVGTICAGARSPIPRPESAAETAPPPITPATIVVMA